MQYCNDCFATMADGAKRCTCCNSPDIRPFAKNISDSVGPQSDNSNGVIRISLEDPEASSSDANGLPSVRILHFAPGTPEYKIQEKQRKKAERDAGRAGGSKDVSRVIAFLAGLTGLLMLVSYVGFNLWPQYGTQDPTSPSQVLQPSLAPTPNGTRPQRLLPAVPITTSGTFKWSATANGQPVRWDSCRPIYWVDNPANELPAVHSAVVQAFERISAQTGLKFVYGGTTRETFSAHRNVATTSVYQGMNPYWKPVLVTFLNKKAFASALASTNNDNPNDVVAFAGPNEIDTADDAVYVSGDITVSNDASKEAIATDGVEKVIAILLHEMGHLVGLAHVSDKNQIMYPYINRLDLGPGDKKGLALAGRGVCRTDSAYPTSDGISWSNPTN